MKTLTVKIQLKKFGSEAWPEGVENSCEVKIPLPDDYDKNISGYQKAFDSCRKYGTDNFIDAKPDTCEAMIEGLKVLARRQGVKSLMETARKSRGTLGAKAGKKSSVTIE